MIDKHYKAPDEKVMGAPTKYRPEYCEKILEYFNVDPYEKHKDKNGNDTDMPPKAPCIEGFADSLGVEKKTLYNWSKKHPDFLHAMNMAKQKERLFVKNAGMSGIYDSRFCHVVYKSICDDSPNVHLCKTIRNKTRKIQEALVRGDITESKAESLKNLVLAEAQVTQVCDLDQRMKAIERKDNDRNKK